MRFKRSPKGVKRSNHRYIYQLVGENYCPSNQYACIFCGMNMRYDPIEGALYRILSDEEKQKECRKCIKKTT